MLDIFKINSFNLLKIFLILASRPHSSYDIIVSNWLAPHTVKHTDNILALIVKLLKPNGKVLLKDVSDLCSALTINGFVNVTKSLDNLYVAGKPKFEVSVFVILFTYIS